MKLIEELFEEAQKQNKKDLRSFIRDRNKQKLREQWILGKFAQNYNQIIEQKMIYADLLNPPSPDFKIFNLNQNWMFDLEITEALDKNRLRDLEYKINGYKFVFVSEDDYMNETERLIWQKCFKNYPEHTILVIYFNVYSYLHDYFESQNNLEYDLFVSLSLPEKCILSEIWLLLTSPDKIIEIL